MLVAALASGGIAEPSKIVLNLNENKRLDIEPYKLYEVHVPLSSIRGEESYWIRSYFSGAVRSVILNLFSKATTWS